MHVDVLNDISEEKSTIGSKISSFACIPKFVQAPLMKSAEICRHRLADQLPVSSLRPSHLFLPFRSDLCGEEESGNLIFGCLVWDTGGHVWVLARG